MLAYQLGISCRLSPNLIKQFAYVQNKTTQTNNKFQEQNVANALHVIRVKIYLITKTCYIAVI